MTIEELREYCLLMPEATEDMPFDESTIAFRVCGKMFALLSLDESSVNLKCDPDKAVELRERYDAVLPGYHMNKRMWNTVVLDRDLPAALIREWVDHSYRLVVAKLPRKDKERLQNL